MKSFVKTYIRYIIYIYLVISLFDNLQRGYDYIQGGKLFFFIIYGLFPLKVLRGILKLIS